MNEIRMFTSYNTIGHRVIVMVAILNFFCYHGMPNNGCHGTTRSRVNIGLLTMNVVRPIVSISIKSSTTNKFSNHTGADNENTLYSLNNTVYSIFLLRKCMTALRKIITVTLRCKSSVVCLKWTFLEYHYIKVAEVLRVQVSN